MSSDRPLVSAIIPTRNRAALLKDAIESALNVRRDGFDDGFDMEIIVIDDGSTDETPQVAAAYPVAYLRTEMQGASAARSTGIAIARGDYIAFLDDDDVWLPDHIAPHLRLFREHPEYGAVFARVQLTDANRVPYEVSLPRAAVWSGWIFEDLLTYFQQLGSVVVRTSVAREVGPFDPTLISEEDWDWLLRIARRYPIGRLDEATVLFRQRGDGDEALSWRRLPDTLRVFRRHTRDLPLPQRVKLERVLWAHRGWYASLFVGNARFHAARGDRARAARCVRYAMLSSPAHVAVLLGRSLRAG